MSKPSIAFSKGHDPALGSRYPGVMKDALDEGTEKAKANNTIGHNI